jgi:ABC-2 type transport system permease protein
MILKYLLEKEFKQFFRNAFRPRLVVIFPVMMMLVLPWVMTMDVRQIHITVSDRDHSMASSRLIRDIDASDYFRLHRLTDSYMEALSDIEYGVADVTLDLPPGFEKDLVGAASAPVHIAVNTVNGTKGLMGGGYLGNILANFSMSYVRAPAVADPSVAAVAPVAPVPRIKTFTQHRYNPMLSYRIYMIPALMVVLLIILCGFMPALNIVSEKERGTIEQINVTPVPRLLFILAKLVPYWLMGFMVLTVCILLARLIYGLTPVANIFYIYLLALLFIFVISGFALIVSNYSATMQQALFVMFFFIMIFQLMSGLLTPIRSMPEWAQWLTVVNPPRYFVGAMRLMYLKGCTFADLTGDFAALAAFGVGFNLWAVWSYRKN